MRAARNCPQYLQCVSWCSDPATKASAWHRFSAETVETRLPRIHPRDHRWVTATSSLTHHARMIPGILPQGPSSRSDLLEKEAHGGGGQGRRVPWAPVGARQAVLPVKSLHSDFTGVQNPALPPASCGNSGGTMVFMYLVWFFGQEKGDDFSLMVLLKG